MIFNRKLSIALLALAAIFSSSALFACGGEASGKHIGAMLKVDAAKSTFTIRDAETSSPITFIAPSAIMTEVKNANGRVMVNYEENEDGGLIATGVTF
ncbi:MAG: hypothetical protein OEM38_09335 [Gammaproteobacteria bacterium]|nr:hypothetical protein [Gammaproteobacteria bacterium]